MNQGVFKKWTLRGKIVQCLTDIDDYGTGKTEVHLHLTLDPEYNGDGLHLAKFLGMKMRRGNRVKIEFIDDEKKLKKDVK